ncbi:RNA methyltransferase [Ekhidna sp.]|jgi:TrmH family RNA methyltransferase|uniref:TrmH family RNA methyltransferase n=2 Tax=unclassified Ekhidna TaxID=2632188 RepID=UPI0032E2854E
MLSRKEQKFIKSLKVKKYRMREKCFLIEGAKNVQELLKSDFDIEMILGTEEFFSLNLKSGDHRNEIVTAEMLQQLGTFKTNEDALAIARTKSYDLDTLSFDDHIFVLDGVGDPGNVGTIIRTLDWFGFDQLICSSDCAEFYHPKVINSTMGSFTRVKVVSCELENFYQNNNLPVYAADMDGNPLDRINQKEPLVMVMGSESHGVSPITLQNMEARITIPRFGGAESLNVGIATGILAGHLRMSR